MTEIVLLDGETIDLAKSSRTKCKKCKKIILKNEIRGKIESEVGNFLWSNYKWICSDCLLIKYRNLNNYTQEQLLIAFHNLQKLPEAFDLLSKKFETRLSNIDTSKLCKKCHKRESNSKKNICIICRQQANKVLKKRSLCTNCKKEKANIRTGLCVACTVKIENKLKFNQKSDSKTLRNQQPKNTNGKRKPKETWFSGPAPGAGSPHSADGRGWSANRRY